MKILVARFRNTNGQRDRSLTVPLTWAMSEDDTRDVYDVTATCFGVRAGERVRIDQSAGAWDVEIRSEHGVFGTCDTECFDFPGDTIIELIAKLRRVDVPPSALRFVYWRQRLGDLEELFDAATHMSPSIVETHFSAAADGIGVGQHVETKRLVLTKAGNVFFQEGSTNCLASNRTGCISLGLIAEKIRVGQRRIYVCDGEEKDFARFVPDDLQSLNAKA